MPKFRFETTAFDQTTVSEEDLGTADLASLRALEYANAALVANSPTGLDHSASVIRVYDEAGYLIATVNFSDLIRSKAEQSDSDLPIEEPGVMRSG